MLILGLLILIGLFVGGLYLDQNSYKYDALGFGMWLVGLLGTIIMIVLIGTLIFYITEGKVIDDRIAMYQEENTQIEKDVEVVVKEYKDYEQDTFDMSEISSPTTLVQMYPELKSDTLVQEQIGVYVSNNDKMKELRNKEIDIKLYKWLLYFGGN